MIHLDSLGIKQSYGAEMHHDVAHVQWLTAGAGIQHEEMWDVGNGVWSDQELFQIWLNLPSEYKMVKPKVELLRRYKVVRDESIPEGRTPIVEKSGTITTIVYGEYDEMSATIDCPTNAAILRVQFTKKATWRYKMPSKHETAILYIRKGSVRVGSELVPVQHTAYLSKEGEELVIDSDGEADVLLLSGEPLREP
jgi:redox-sensitive bicupin YhaK (pirin superfamily)